MSTTTQSVAADLESIEAWKDMLAELAPAQGTWSEEEYLGLTDHRKRLVEYTDGYLEILPLRTAAHQMILKLLFLSFFSFFETRGGNVLFAPLRMRVRAGKFREPALMVLLSAKDPRSQNRFWLGADVALEVVSEEKPERDLVDKRSDYAEANIPEYWIVNPQTQTITVLELRGGAYTEAGVYGRGQAARSVLAPGFSVDVTVIFDSAKTN